MVPPGIPVFGYDMLLTDHAIHHFIYFPAPLDTITRCHAGFCVLLVIYPPQALTRQLSQGESLFNGILHAKGPHPVSAGWGPLAVYT